MSVEEKYSTNATVENFFSSGNVQKRFFDLICNHLYSDFEFETHETVFTNMLSFVENYKIKKWLIRGSRISYDVELEDDWKSHNFEFIFTITNLETQKSGELILDMFKEVDTEETFETFEDTILINLWHSD